MDHLRQNHSSDRGGPENRGNGSQKLDETATRALSYEESYRCPACAQGNLSAIALMDIFACDFCRHMFTANLQTQSVHLADSLQPMAWQWTGHRWRAAHQAETSAYIIWSFAAVLLMGPVTLIALPNYIFPPSGGLRFVVSWCLLTLLSHGLIAGWLLAEYQRWPWYIASQARFSRWREQLQIRPLQR